MGAGARGPGGADQTGRGINMAAAQLIRDLRSPRRPPPRRSRPTPPPPPSRRPLT